MFFVLLLSLSLYIFSVLLCFMIRYLIVITCIYDTAQCLPGDWRRDERTLNESVEESFNISLPPSLSHSVSTSFSGGLLILLEIPTRTHFIRTDVSITFYGYLCRERDSRQRTRKPKTTTTTTTTTKATRGQTEETL